MAAVAVDATTVDAIDAAAVDEAAVDMQLPVGGTEQLHPPTLTTNKTLIVKKVCRSALDPFDFILPYSHSCLPLLIIITSRR